MQLELRHNRNLAMVEMVDAIFTALFCVQAIAWHAPCGDGGGSGWKGQTQRGGHLPDEVDKE